MELSILTPTVCSGVVMLSSEPRAHHCLRGTQAASPCAGSFTSPYAEFRLPACCSVTVVRTFFGLHNPYQHGNFITSLANFAISLLQPSPLQHCTTDLPCENTRFHRSAVPAFSAYYLPAPAVPPSRAVSLKNLL